MSVIDKSFFKHEFSLLCKISEMKGDAIVWLLQEHRKFQFFMKNVAGVWVVRTHTKETTLRKS